MSQELVYILTACAMLGVLYLYTVLNSPERREGRRAKDGERTEANPESREPSFFYALTYKIDELFKVIESLKPADVESLKTSLKSVKRSVEEFEARTNLKLGRDEETKRILRSSLSRINKKIEEIIARYESELKKFGNEKAAADKELEAMAQEAVRTDAEKAAEIMQLEAQIEAFRESAGPVNIPELKETLEPLQVEVSRLTAEYEEERAKIANGPRLNDTALSVARRAADDRVKSGAEERMRRVSELRVRVEMLESTVTDLKREILTNQEKYIAESGKFSAGIASAKALLAQFEEDKNTAEKLIAERQSLQENLDNLKEQIAAQKKKFEQEATEKDATIAEINAAAGAKLKDIKESAAVEESEFLAEKAVLDDEIARLRNQIETIKTSGGRSLADLKKDIGSLEERHRKKEAEYSGVNRERIERERIVKDELTRAIEDFRRGSESALKKFSEALRQKNDEIYNLKVRLSAREDKLKTDIATRRETGAALIKDLRRTSEALRQTYSKESEENRTRIAPMLERIEAVKGNFSALEGMIAREQMISAKLESERRRIEQEINTVRKKLEEDTLQAKRLAGLKDMYVARLSEEIIEKERLFDAERKARSQILQGKYLAKTGKEK
jgi:chromosome segregation ATPase